MDMETADVDLALCYSAPANLPAQAQRLFGEQLTPALSPWLLGSGPRLEKPQDLAQFALVEAADAHRHAHAELLTWQRWFPPSISGISNPGAGCRSITRTRSPRSPRPR